VDIEVKLLRSSSIMPVKAHATDAGFDVFVSTITDTDKTLHYQYNQANIARDVFLPLGKRVWCGLGIATKIPVGYFALCAPRSGLACKHGITFGNTPAIIDSDFRGEWLCCVCNYGDADYKLSVGDKILQFVILPLPQVTLKAVHELDVTARGVGGFGSTGRN